MDTPAKTPSPARKATPACTPGNTTTLTGREGRFGISRAEYRDDMERCWVIRPELAEGERVLLHFPRVQVEVHYDFVWVRGLDEAEETEVQEDQSYVSTAGFHVRFKTDSSETGGGWEATWKIQQAPLRPV